MFVVNQTGQVQPLTPAFDPDITEYTVHIGGTTRASFVRVESMDPGALVHFMPSGRVDYAAGEDGIVVVEEPLVLIIRVTSETRGS